MFPDTPSLGQLSHVIAQAMAPAFLLGAFAALIAIMVARLNRIIDKTVALNSISNEDTASSRLKAHIPLLARRAAMMQRAIFWAVISSIATTILMIVAFVSAFLHVAHERGVALLFIAALGTFTVSLVDFAREIRMSLHELDHYG